VLTERLELRPLAPGDADFILRLLNEPSFLANIGDRGVRTREQAERYIEEGPARSFRENGFGLYRVGLRDGGEAVGVCGLIRREGLDAPDLGFALLPEHWGRGYAHEAAVAVLAQGRQRLGLERVLAIVLEENLGSVRLLGKLGFERQGTVQLPGDDTELELYALGRDRAGRGSSPGS
jgi:RimJ/RimL family protein N-acetyltransferase